MPGIAPVTKSTTTAIMDTTTRVATVTTPAAAVGDWLVAIASHDWGFASQLPAPGGTAGTWTKRAGGNTGEINQVHSGVWFRKVTAAGAQTVTSSGSATSSDVVLLVMVLDGTTVDAVDPFDVAANVVNGGAAAVTAHTAPAVDPADDNLDGVLFTVHSAQKNVTYTGPAGMTLVGTSLVSRTYVTQAVYRLALVGAATEPATAAKTATASVSSGYAACTFAVKGRASGATPVYTSSKTGNPVAGGPMPPTGYAVAYGAVTNDGRYELYATNSGSGTTYSGLKTADQANGALTFDAFWLETVALPVDTAGDGNACPAMIWLASASQPAGTRLGWEFDPRDGTLSARVQVGYGNTDQTVLRFEPLWHRWWKLLLSGGNMLWQTSHNGTTWVTRKTATSPAWVGADESVSIETYRTTGANDRFAFRSLNLAPSGQPPDGDFFLAMHPAA